ncbi:hypothetical protein [Nocardia ignorata]|uniref:Uncharacterized protein n=1 Tax=Nocardia ignorata TaxID=145285 RepID=A0A4R6P0I1_NOCIG|nr:hypothetical protein [Nocardia ignorata]TDP29895.1 hypothetical protein DFR75_112164 [Nocardia ignorata]
MSTIHTTVPKQGQYRNHKLRAMRLYRGLPSPIIDATPAQDHVNWLVSIGFNDSSVAAAAGLTQNTIRDFRLRKYSTARRQYAARVLAVTHIPTPDQESRNVPAIGTQRRIQALQAAGHTQAQIGTHLGWTQERVDKILRSKSVKGRTFQQVCAVYDLLSHQVGPSAIGKTRSARRGYAPPLAWEGIDIDHPDSTPILDAEPATGCVDEVLLQRIIEGRHTYPDANPLRGPERIAVIDHAITHGWLRARLAAALNISMDGADQALVRRRRELREAA